MDYNVPTLRQSLSIEREAISLQAKSSATTAFICFEHIVMANGSAASKCVTAAWGRSEFVPGGTILVRDGIREWEGSIVESEDDVVEIAIQDTLADGYYDLEIKPEFKQYEWLDDALLQPRAHDAFDLLHGRSNNVAINASDHCTLSSITEHFSLEPSQRIALEATSTAQISAIDGPAGGGKSTCILALLLLHFLHNRRVLVVSPSNAPVDKLCQEWCKVANLQVPTVVRLYSETQRYLGNVDPELCAHRTATTTRSNLQAVLKNAQFVFTTTSLALHPALPLHFDHVIVEESSRCNVAMGVACFTRGRAITFVGDGKQLDAFTAINKYLPIADAIHWRQYASKTILDLCRDAFVPVVPIVEQHRMNHSLARMTNDLFSGLMVGHRNDSPHDDSSFLLPNGQMVLVIDTFDYVSKPQSEYHELVRQQFYPRVETSPYNFTETKAVADLLSEGMLRGWKPQSVVILANYHEQNRLNSMLFQEHPLVKSVTTVGKFQGYQADVVILTLASSSVGFFDNFKRQYVALSRSRNALVVVGNIKPYLENPRVRYIMKALLAISRGETISHSRHHGLTELPKFTLTPTTWAPQRCLVCTTSMMPNTVLYGNTFYQALYAKVATSLQSHFGCPLLIKFGKLMLPDASIVHINLVAFPIDNVANAESLAATLGSHDFPSVEIRTLTEAEIELLSDIPRTARNLLRQGTNHIITPPLTRAIYRAFFAASCPHIPPSLYPSSFAAYQPPPQSDNHHCQCGAMLLSNICHWCQFANIFPHQHTQFVVTPTTEWIDSNHQFSDHLCINTTAHPVLVGRCNPYQVFACMVANSTLPKWQCNEGPHVFPTGGPNQPPQLSMATLLNRMRLCPANVIFRNVFLSPSAAARSHVDDDCFVTKHTFLINFGDPIPLQWDNSTIYLKHCGIYAFDASKKHSLPIWPRFSISLRSWDTGSATPCEDDHVTKKIRPNPSN